MRLVNYLTKKQLSQTAFAAEIGVPPGTISRYLRGSRMPSWDHAERIYIATGERVTPNDFLFERMARRRKSAK